MPRRALEGACARHGLSYEINEGDGAFYGPKIDIKVKDAIGRTWQCSTVQVDFNMPERFGLTYRTEDNTEERPWMLHRAIFGSIERFLGILIEHYAGALPLWLAPVQAAVLPLADRHNEAAHELAWKLKADAGGRVEVYDQNEPMRVKIAKAQSQKIPYMVVLGDKEIENGTVSRARAPRGRSRRVGRGEAGADHQGRRAVAACRAGRRLRVVRPSGGLRRAALAILSGPRLVGGLFLLVERGFGRYDGPG